jgi:chromosomal replication initiation ATPase DnaA
LTLFQYSVSSSFYATQSQNRCTGCGSSHHDQANEQLVHSQSIENRGYDFQTIVQRVAVLLDLPTEEIQGASKRSAIVKARNMVCFWAYTHLGMNQTQLALKFGVSQPAVCAAVQKGQKIIEQNKYDLMI